MQKFHLCAVLENVTCLLEAPRGLGPSPRWFPVDPVRSGLSGPWVPPSEEQAAAARRSLFALLQSGRLSGKRLRHRASLLPRPASPSPHGSQVCRAGPCAAASRPPWGPAEPGSRRLSSPKIPRQLRRRLASSPEAKWSRLEGGHAAAGMRCVPCRLPGSAQR